MTTIEKLNKAYNSKVAVKSAIIAKGVEVGDKFEEYADAITNLPSGGGTITIDESVNLHNTENITANYYLNGGEETSYNGWSISDYIPLDNEYLCICTDNTVNSRYCYIYDENKEKLRCPEYSIGIYAIIKTPKKGYIRMSGISSIIQSIKVYKINGITSSNIQEI